VRSTAGGFSPSLQAAWSNVLAFTCSDQSALPPDLAANVLSLWQRFTKHRGPTPDVYMDLSESRRAYLAYYFPVNVAKVLSLLAEMPEPAISAHSLGLRVLDMGSGPGTGALAVLDWSRTCPSLSNMKLTVTAVDASQAALHEAGQLWEAYRSITHIDAASLVTVQANAERAGFWKTSHCASQSYDLIIVANMLNEIFRNRADPTRSRVAFVRRLLDLLDDHGTLMIIEPALRETSRALHLVRDAVLAAGGCNVYSPCLHEQPCPALVNKDDWCHEERMWCPPRLVGMLDRQVGFIKDSLKFSYLLLRKDGRHIVPRAPGLYRVVSELRQMKGERRAWLCDQEGRPEVGRLDRERSVTNVQFDDWCRGAIVRVAELDWGIKPGSARSVARIRKGSSVELVRPVRPMMTDEET